ncbi:MAG: hypothetical protein LBV43_00165 [Prevotella sp.]|nr:hypothetical protein [Prevotella sp.]
MSEAIWYSWDHVEFPFHQLYPDGRMYPEMEIPAAIDGLSWTAQTAFEKLGWYLDYFSYNIYAPFLLMISIFSVYYVLSNIHRLGDCIFAVKPKKNNGIGISYILIFQFCTLLPLYVIAVDYGRWIYFWVVSSFVIDYFIPRLNILGIAPRIYIKCVDFFNLTIRYAIGNSKGTIMILTLCIGFSYVYSDLISTFITSSAYITMSKFSNLFVRFFLFLESLI